MLKISGSDIRNNEITLLYMSCLFRLSWKAGIFYTFYHTDMGIYSCEYYVAFFGVGFTMFLRE